MFGVLLIRKILTVSGLFVSVGYVIFSNLFRKVVKTTARFVLTSICLLKVRKQLSIEQKRIRKYK